MYSSLCYTLYTSYLHNYQKYVDKYRGAAIEELLYYFSSYLPPARRYWYLDVPAKVAVGMNADRAHRANYTVWDIKVIMVDS
jgi:hypothetical protein